MRRIDEIKNYIKQRKQLQRIAKYNVNSNPFQYIIKIFVVIINTVKSDTIQSSVIL